MNVERALQIAVAVLAALGTFMLGMSEEHYGLAIAAVVMGIASFWLCDVLGWIRLQVWAANLGAMVALAVASYQFIALGAESRVLALADLMGYLQFVLLFKSKTNRNCWLLAVVSFLQVSVAAALNTGLIFSVMLAVYLITAVFFLALFYLYRESQRAAEAAGVGAIPSGEFGLFPRRAPAAPAAMFGDWTRRLVGIILGTVGLAAVFFVAVPRIGQANWVAPGIVAARTVGFSPEINLTRSGEVVEDPEMVMQVRFFDAETGKPYQIDGEPYLRGASVSQYAGGRWRSQNFEPSRGTVRPPPAGSQHLVRQTTLIEPLSSNTLFAVAPAFSDQAIDAIRVNPYIGRLDRTEAYRTRSFSYELLTTGFRRHRQLDMIPLWDEISENAVSQLKRLPRSNANGDPLARLKSIAASVVTGIPATDRYRRAKALEAFLRDSGRFAYTLDTPQAPPDVDPIDEFVAVHRRGHCELFAGALALMLRSVDIPARVVLGYRGGEYNVIGNLYLVRQLHAHSWVEAHLTTSDQIPPQRLSLLGDEADPAAVEANGAAAAALRHGVWLQLDPTTSNDLAQAAAAESRWGEVQQVLDYLRFLWSNYVVGMDSEKQHESVYEPVRQWLHETVHDLMQPESWRHAFQQTLHYANPLHWLPDDVPLFSWRGGLTLVGGIVCLWAVGFAVYHRLRRRRTGRTVEPAQRARPAPPPIDFYVQLEAALKRRNLTRTPEQTPREFVLAACGELAELPATRGVSNLPRKIVEAFYRVRFGGRTLSATERSEVEQALAQLAAALEPPPAATA